jgi:hypothetical protein
MLAICHSASWFAICSYINSSPIWNFAWPSVVSWWVCRDGGFGDGRRTGFLLAHRIIIRSGHVVRSESSVLRSHIRARPFPSLSWQARRAINLLNSARRKTQHSRRAWNGLCPSSVNCTNPPRSPPIPHGFMLHRLRAHAPHGAEAFCFGRSPSLARRLLDEFGGNKFGQIRRSNSLATTKWCGREDSNLHALRR